MKKKLIIIIGIILVVVLFIGGKKYMDKKAVEKDYQQGMKLIQTYVTEYLIDNYEGIEKIEWQGIGVEWRNSPVFGSSMFGNYVNSNVNVYVSEDNYFNMEFRLNDYTEYDDDLEKYVFYKFNNVPVLNPSNMDASIQNGIHNAIYGYSGDSDIKNIKVTEKEKLALEKKSKSSNGSLDAQVIYSLDIHELTY